MRFDQPRRILIGFGLCGTMLTAAVTSVLLYYGQGYFDDGYELSVTFDTSAQGIFTDGATDVKMQGMRIGSVTDVELLDDGRARIDLFINDSAQIPETALARIEPLSVFGPKFIRIDPGAGSKGPYLADGDYITDTLPPIEFTSIIANAAKLFETVDATELVTILDTLSDSAAGLGPDLGATIDATSELTALGTKHIDDIGQFLADVGVLSEEIAENTQATLSILDDLDSLLPVLAENPERMKRLLEATVAITEPYGQLVGENAEEIASTIGALDGFVGGVADNAEDIPVFLELLGTFFGGLGDVVRMNGPAGSDTKLAALRGFIAIDLCDLLGICLPMGGE